MTGDYSVWLQLDPASSEYLELKELIDEYSQRYEDAPVFEPHITLLGGLSDNQSTINETAGAIAQKYQPLEVSFPRVHCSTTRFQCVFLLVEPILELLSLHEDAVEMFRTGGGMYVPHLSLIYSDMELGERLKLTKEIDSRSPPDSARLNSIAVVETTSDPPEWEMVAEYEL